MKNKYHREAEKLIKETIKTLQQLLPQDGEDISYYTNEFLTVPRNNLINAQKEMVRADLYRLLKKE